MPNYSVVLSDQAAKFLRKLQRKLQERIREKIFELEQDPYAYRELKHNKGTRKIRVGKTRTFYEIDEQSKIGSGDQNVVPR